jgi:Sulfatase
MAKKDKQNQTKPNILIIWGDDIGWFNISANNNGMMGYRTPNIDRVAREGALFTDWYAPYSWRSFEITKETFRSDKASKMGAVAETTAPSGTHPNLSDRGIKRETETNKKNTISLLNEYL